MTPSGSTVVGIDASPGADDALRWAMSDAATLHGDVRVVCAYRGALAYRRLAMFADLPKIDLGHFRNVAESVTVKAIARAAAVDATVTVRSDAVDGDPVPVLLTESQHARILVLGSRRRDALDATLLGSVSGGVAARASCPTVVLRGPAGRADEGAAVVVGVDGGEEAQTLLQFAFDHASRHGTPLRAVLCWHHDMLATMMWRGEPPAPIRAEVWLSEILAGWREKYPDVAVHSGVIREHPATGLVTESSAAQLLVVGSHGRHALAGALLGSVSQAVLHHATCPVAVVPTRIR
jgi:nucleotide-binding universal stress UspA family protein